MNWWKATGLITLADEAQRARPWRMLRACDEAVQNLKKPLNTTHVIVTEPAFSSLVSTKSLCEIDSDSS